MFMKPTLAISKRISLIIYITQWVIVIILGILNAFQDPISAKLQICRYDTATTIPMINTGYCALIIIGIIVVFCAIQINVCKRINKSYQETEIEAYKLLRIYFVFIICLLSVKIVSYLLKEGITLNFFYLIDRVFENITSLILMITLVIGKKGFKEAKQLFFNCSKNENREKFTQLPSIAYEEQSEDSSSDY